MKILSFVKSQLCLLGMCLLLVGCSDHEIDISVTDSENEFSLHAKYDPDKTRKVYSYLNDALDTDLFGGDNKRIDGNLKMDDQIDIFVKAKEGDLTIKMDKDKNSPSSYRRMKTIYTDLREIMMK